MNMNEIDIRRINVRTKEYDLELDLRNEVLRKPIGLNIYNEDLNTETNDYHIGAFINDNLIAVLILTVLDNDKIKMRQVAVKEEYRGKHIGSKLVLFAEDFAIKIGKKKMVLNARKTAVEFYKKLGYRILGDEFIEVGIHHFKMEKDL